MLEHVYAGAREKPKRHGIMTMNDMLTQAQAVERELSPQERAIVEYHRSNLANPGRDPQGRPVTVFSTGIYVPSGRYAGKFVSVPGFVGGKIVDDERELWRIWQKEINAGKWPIYESGEELNSRSQQIHQIMDAETP